MTVKHIIFDASVLAKFPQSEIFFKTARNSDMGKVAYICSHCVPRTDIQYILDLLYRKAIDVIVLSKTPAGTGQVMDALGISYSRSINSLDEIEDEASDYGYVTTIVKERERARAQGFRAVRFVPGIGQDGSEVLSLAGYRKQTNESMDELSKPAGQNSSVVFEKNYAEMWKKTQEARSEERKDRLQDVLEKHIGDLFDRMDDDNSFE